MRCSVAVVALVGLAALGGCRQATSPPRIPLPDYTEFDLRSVNGASLPVVAWILQPATSPRPDTTWLEGLQLQLHPDGSATWQEQLRMQTAGGGTRWSNAGASFRYRLSADSLQLLECASCAPEYRGMRARLQLELTGPGFLDGSEQSLLYRFDQAMFMYM